MVLLAVALIAGIACSRKVPEKTAETKDGSGAPKIEAVSPEFDFGKVKQGITVEHTYKIKNVGSKDLVIEKTKGS
jgi:hypothetical protein